MGTFGEGVIPDPQLSLSLLEGRWIVGDPLNAPLDVLRRVLGRLEQPPLAGEEKFFPPFCEGL